MAAGREVGGAMAFLFDFLVRVRKLWVDGREWVVSMLILMRL